MTERERQKVNEILDNKEIMEDINMYNEYKNETGCKDMSLSNYLKGLKQDVIELHKDYDNKKDEYINALENLDDKTSADKIATAQTVSVIEDRDEVEKMNEIVHSEYYAQLIEAAEILEAAGEDYDVE